MEPMFKYVGNMHGNEVVSRQVLLYLAEYLASGYGRDGRITRLLNTTEIFIMPTLNPDGYEVSQEGQCDNNRYETTTIQTIIYSQYMFCV